MKSKPLLDRSTWWFMGVLLVLSWCVYLYLFLPGMGTGGLMPPDLDEPAGRPMAAYGWEVVDLDGARVDLSRYRGRPLFLNVWATWCGPCIIEMPTIARLAADPRLKDVAFVGVSVDNDLESVRRFVRERPLGITPLVANGPPPPAFDTDGAIPVTFLIAPDGRIVARQIGVAKWDAPEVIAALEAMTKPEPAKR